MSLFSAVWLADLIQDRPKLPIREQNTAIGGEVWDRRRYGSLRRKTAGYLYLVIPYRAQHPLR